MAATIIKDKLGLLKIKEYSGNFEKAGVDFFKLKAKTLEGEDFDFSKLAGKVTLITNVACDCGYTQSNYTQLNEIYAKYSDRLNIIGFPSNEFGGQESRTPKDIRSFLNNLNVKFLIMEKSEVNGPNTHPVYKALKAACGTEKKDIKWNFETKFLISKDGKRVEQYSKAFEPKALISKIEEFVNESSKL